MARIRLLQKTPRRIGRVSDLPRNRGRVISRGPVLAQRGLRGMRYNIIMENKNIKPMSEWDRHVCAHLDDLLNKHNSGELKAGDVDVIFANARVKVEQAIKEQQAQRVELLSAQPRNYAI